MRSPVLALALTLLMTSCRSGCASGDRAHIVQATREGIMGTRIQVKVWTDGTAHQRRRASQATEDAFEAAREVNSRMSPYLAHSAVSRINEGAGKEGVEVDEWTFEVIRRSLWASRITSGAFDPTWAVLAPLWDVHSKDPLLPDEALVKQRLGLVDYRQVTVDQEASRVRLERRGMKLDLGGSAKGFALDRMAQAVRDRHFDSFICEAGGDLFVAGTHGDRPWKLGIRHPRVSGEIVATYEVHRDMAVVTSGDYERFFMLDGKRYHHILDPATGFPARGLISVTLFGSRGLDADALSTGIFVLGLQRGMELVEKIQDLDAVIIDDGGVVHVSSGMEDQVEVIATITP